MNVIFEVKDEMGKMHHVPADLLALKDAFFDELFLIRKIIEYHCKEMDIIDIAQQQTPPIFPIGNFSFPTQSASQSQKPKIET